MIDLAASLDLARFNTVFARYLKKTSKLPEEALAKKGRDLGIQLFKEFVQHKWGGPGKHPGLAHGELSKRTEEGRGTKVRASLRAEYLSARGDLRKEAKSLKKAEASFAGTLDQWSANQGAADKNRAARVSLWQAFVGKEVAIRQRGIGALAAAFLWYRTRPATATRGKVVVRNSSGKVFGFSDAGDGYFRIVSDAEGAALVDRRYGIVDSALQTLTVDMLEYFRTRHKEIYESVWNEMEAVT